MSAVSVTLYAVAMAVCVLSTAVTTRGSSGKPLRFFTMFLAIEALSFLCELWIAHPATPYKAAGLAVLMASALLQAPCLWLAVQEGVTGVAPALRSLPRRQVWAMVAGALCVLPLASSAHAGTGYANPSMPMPWLYSRVIHATMLICIGVFVAQVPGYLLRCRELLLGRLGGRPRQWAVWPLAIVSTTWLLAIVRTLDCAFLKWPPLFSCLVAFISVCVTVASLYLLLREFSPPAATGTQSYARSRLGIAVRRRIRRKLEAALAQQGIFQRSDLSLGILAQLLKERPHYVSQVISQEFSSSFHDLVNGVRIEHAKRRLRESPDCNVLEIALESGFNSKSAFHTAFRRVTGTTPSNFRRIK